MSDREFYVEMLKSEECLCERPKKRGYPFCYRCYQGLPGELKQGLYLRMGEGYESAYEEAVRWLEP